MGLFDRLFGEKNEPVARNLEHPRDLQEKDIITFSFTPWDEFSHQRFVVQAVNNYNDPNNYSYLRRVCVLEGEENPLPLYLAVTKERGIDQIEIFQAITADITETLFNMEQLIAILEGEEDAGFLECYQHQDNLLDKWTAPSYSQEIAAKYLTLEGEPLNYYRLLSDDSQYILEINVFEQGKTDVYLGVRIPLNKIEELWPA